MGEWVEQTYEFVRSNSTLVKKKKGRTMKEEEFLRSRRVVKVKYTPDEFEEELNRRSKKEKSSYRGVGLNKNSDTKIDQDFILNVIDQVIEYFYEKSEVEFDMIEEKYLDNDGIGLELLKQNIVNRSKEKRLWLTNTKLSAS